MLTSFIEKHDWKYNGMMLFTKPVYVGTFPSAPSANGEVESIQVHYKCKRCLSLGTFSTSYKDYLRNRFSYKNYHASTYNNIKCSNSCSEGLLSLLLK